MNALLIMAILFLEILSYKQDKPAQVELRKKKKKEFARGYQISQQVIGRISSEGKKKKCPKPFHQILTGKNKQTQKGNYWSLGHCVANFAVKV